MFPVHGRTERCGIFIILAAVRPVGIGIVVEDQNAFQRLFIVRIFRVVRGNLKHKVSTGGNLDPLEAHLQTFHIIGEVFGCESAVHRCGQLKRNGFHCSVDVLVCLNRLICHNFFPP